MIRASNENWAAYLTRVRGYLPEEFESDIMDENLTEKTGAYIFAAFMKDDLAENCARALVEKLGVDDGEL